MIRLVAIDPESLPRAPAHSRGVKGCGDVLVIAAQAGCNREGRLVSADLAEQYAQALDNVLDVVWAGGGKPDSLARLTVYLTDLREWRRRGRAIEEAHRRRLGDHRPALTVVEVKGLPDDEAQVAIEGVAFV